MKRRALKIHHHTLDLATRDANHHGFVGSLFGFGEDAVQVLDLAADDAGFAGAASVAKRHLPRNEK